jgi:uncharacterized protein (TIGR02996 family)
MSSERTALIAAIRAAPDDDAVRLVCADWFEDQGDEASVARAEFIRTQIARVSLPPEDIRQSELQARELRLLKRYGPAWCGAHFLFRKVRFRRGFIEYVHLHLRHFLHHRRQILALEPVRDISLTGWHRAPTDLIRRVAGCEEWKYIETLRIHHQGPHKDPGSDLVILLESPHLTRLRVLRCPRLSLTADARRRFERLPILRHVKELHLPYLDRWPENPGGWLEDAGATVAEDWSALKSVVLPDHLDLGLLQRLSAKPFWRQLTELDLVLTWEGGEALALLRERMPESLRVLRLSSGSIPAQFTLPGPFIERLAQAPLQGLHLSNIAIDPPTLDRLLNGENRWGLRELSLSGCDITAEQTRILAASSKIRTILSLNLSHNWDFKEDAARVLFSSSHLRSVVHLDLEATRVGREGANALASEGWDRLRSLNLVDAQLGDGGLRALLGSANVRRLTWLAVSGGRFRDDPALDISEDLAGQLIDANRTPYLTRLSLGLGHCDPRPRQILSESDSLPWVSLECGDVNIQTWRAARASECWPPVDAAFEEPMGYP